MKQPVVFFVFQKHSIFMPLRYIYPECMTLIEPFPQLSPLHCLKTDICPANQSCMDILVKRVDYIFTNVVPNGSQIIAYFKYRDRPNSLRAGIFNRDLEEPKLMTLNQSAFKKFQKEGTAFTWIPTDEFLLIAPNTKLLTVESLLSKPYER